jgi:hypothetical protein
LVTRPSIAARAPEGARKRSKKAKKVKTDGFSGACRSAMAIGGHGK